MTSLVLSGTILKLLFARILMSEIVMRKLDLKIGMILQKSELLASMSLYFRTGKLNRILEGGAFDVYLL